MTAQPVFLLFLVLGVCVARGASAQSLLWDEPDQTGVAGYAVTVDGVRTDYGMRPVASNGGCGCAVPFPFTSGTHTVVVAAYGPNGESASSPVVLDLSSAPTPVGPAPGPVAAPWTMHDIGAVGAAGFANVLNGTLTVGGSGDDIWGVADAFAFVSQPFSGDGEIVVRVTGTQNTNPYAKAGLMWRDALTAGSAHVGLDVRPDGSVEFMTRTTAGGSTSFIAGGWQAMPVWLKLSRTGSTVIGSVSADGSVWTRVGSTTVASTATSNVGVAVTSHVAGTVNTSTFDNLRVTSATTQTNASVPPPWTSADIGATGLAGGGSSPGSGAFSVIGAGADIWGSSDAFHFVSQPVTGDAEIVARVTAEQNTNVFAKAGVMLRGSSTASAPHVILDARPDGSIEFMARQNDGGPTTFLAGATQPLPAWVKLARTGSTIAAFVSANGSTWTTVGSTTTTVGTAAVIGLAVTSHDVTVGNAASFDHVAVVSTPATGVPGPTSNVVVYAADIPAAGRHGVWSSGVDTTSPAGVTLTTADSGVAIPDRPLAAPADYVDVTFNAAAAIPYRVWLRLKAAGNSKYNDSVWVQFADATVNGAPVYQTGSTNGLLMNLATDSSGSSLSGWGWSGGAYWLTQPTTISFPTSGPHTLRIQVREDGVAFDQIVLSPAAFLTAAPGSTSGDGTIVPKP